MDPFGRHIDYLRISVNISLDTLDPTAYRKLTGGRLQVALDGIHAATVAGFEVVKLNCVLLRGINENQMVPLVEFGASLGMPVRFIELMPLAPGGPIDARHFFSVAEAMERLLETGIMEPANDILEAIQFRSLDRKLFS